MAEPVPLAQALDQLDELEPGAIPATMALLAAAQAKLAARAMAEAATHNGTEAPTTDRLLTAADVAGRLSVETGYVYDHAADWPFTIRQGRSLRFSERGLERWLRRRQGRA